MAVLLHSFRRAPEPPSTGSEDIVDIESGVRNKRSLGVVNTTQIDDRDDITNTTRSDDDDDDDSLIDVPISDVAYYETDNRKDDIEEINNGKVSLYLAIILFIKFLIIFGGFLWYCARDLILLSSRSIGN
jgi:hypothetical protein